MKKNKVTANLYGKYTFIIPDKDKIEFRTIEAYIIIISVWLLAMAFFFLSTLLNNLIICFVAAIIGGIIGYILPLNLLKGKLAQTYTYEELNCIKYKAPELTFFKKDNYMFSTRLFPKNYNKLISLIAMEIRENEEIDFVSEHNAYYFKAKQ